MTASSYTDWFIECDGIEEDGRPCMAQGRTDIFGVTTATQVRTRLAVVGWLVAVRVDGQDRPQDYCPRHKPERN